VLAFSPIPLLRDFGIVVALGVLIALASTLILLPALLVWADEQPLAADRPCWRRGGAEGAGRGLGARVTMAAVR